MGVYEYGKLLGRMKERRYTQEALASKIGISACSMNLTLNNKRDFRQDEMLKICEVLHIPTEEIDVYFFAHNL